MPSQIEEHKTRRLPSFPVLEQGLHAKLLPGRFGELRDEECVSMTAPSRLPIFGSSHLQTLTVTWSPFLNSRIVVTEWIFLGRTHILGDQGLEAF